MASNLELRKTPLNEIHKQLGAKMVPFSGWEMPVQYSGIMSEHLATRSNAGIFDVSHMGEIFLKGEKEILLSFLQNLTCNDVSKLSNNQVQYNAVLNEKGGLVDDITLYKFNDTKYMVCSNASNYESVYAHFQKYNNGLTISNESSAWHQIALQGPKANQILSDYLKTDLNPLGYYRFQDIKIFNEDCILSRTGYTGEDGFEIYTPNPVGVKLWNELLQFGKTYGLVPVGLGARDTLRLEAKYPLYGHELSSELTPIESGIAWIVKDKGVNFLGSEKILTQLKSGAQLGSAGIKLLEPGVIRENYPVLNTSGEKIGYLTSGTYSPSLKQGIGLALLDKTSIVNEKEILVEIRGETKKGIIHTKNFISGSVRKN
ncbi:MAG: glycine cleavage system aminomethyltransferase GcvT [Leptospiraceae bacterium]|nr:glycine cleavage system aminomethyltransferase GcvT [Leptospiraceae bacterium]